MNMSRDNTFNMTFYPNHSNNNYNFFNEPNGPSKMPNEEKSVYSSFYYQ